VGRLATNRPVPCGWRSRTQKPDGRQLLSGSFATPKTIGMTDVVRFAATTAAPDMTITSTFKRTNSAAIST
jgi:hypothetical protein